MYVVQLSVVPAWFMLVALSHCHHAALRWVLSRCDAMCHLVSACVVGVFFFFLPGGTWVTPAFQILKSRVDCRSAHPKRPGVITDPTKPRGLAARAVINATSEEEAGAGAAAAVLSGDTAVVVDDSAVDGSTVAKDGSLTASAEESDARR